VARFLKAAAGSASERNQSAAGDHDPTGWISARTQASDTTSSGAWPRIVAKKKKTKFDYLAGTMIEIPRAPLLADEIARDAPILQLRHQRSHPNDAGDEPRRFGKFSTYLRRARHHRYKSVCVDRSARRRPFDGNDTRSRPENASQDIKLGICGEHGGEPNSVKFCHRLGLDYVSCSPFRIPIARLAAAQAAIAE